MKSPALWERGKLGAGFIGRGFNLSPAVGIVMTEPVLEGQAYLVDINPLPLNRFRKGDFNQTTYEFKAIA